MSFISRLMSWLNLSSVDLESWANKNSKLTTPDDLIEGAIIADIAKNFDNWTISEKPADNYGYYNAEGQQVDHGHIGTWKNSRAEEQSKWMNKYVADGPNRFQVNRCLENKTKKIKILFRMNSGESCAYFTVNGTSITDQNGTAIVLGYFRLGNQLRETKRKADEAKAQMELSEKKWNLAESLLGMKRNEFGALVPISKCTINPDVECKHGCEFHCHDDPVYLEEENATAASR